MRCCGLELTKPFFFYLCRSLSAALAETQEGEASAGAGGSALTGGNRTRRRGDARPAGGPLSLRSCSTIYYHRRRLRFFVLALCHNCLPPAPPHRRHQAKKKQVTDRIEGRQKRKRARELDNKAQIAARLEVLLRIRRLKQGSVSCRPPPPTHPPTLLPSSVSF